MFRLVNFHESSYAISAGKQWTTSLNIAEVFGKEHRHILDKIENLECSQQFAETNFRLGQYADKNNQMRKMYDITRDGFTFLAMGFIGSAYCAYPNQRIRGVDRMNTEFFHSLLSGTFMGLESDVRIDPAEAFWC